MTDDADYFARAESWAQDSRIREDRSRRVAWSVAGAALGIAALEAVAIAVMLPLKSTTPVAMLVDRQTGFVETIDPAAPKKLAADDALVESLLAQYVTAREGFDRATVRADFRKVGLWSVGPARKAYLAAMPSTNPASPLNTFPAGMTAAVEVKSVSRLAAGAALIRFNTQVLDRSGQAQSREPWIAILRYGFSKAPMTFEDRLVNPLGLQVSGYRRDPEAPVSQNVRWLARDGQVQPEALATATMPDGTGRGLQLVSPVVPPNAAPDRARLGSDGR